MSVTTTGPTRILAFDEHATWGKCPECGAPQGVVCVTADGQPIWNVPPFDEYHMVRFLRAPLQVCEVAVEEEGGTER